MILSAVRQIADPFAYHSGECMSSSHQLSNDDVVFVLPNNPSPPRNGINKVRLMSEPVRCLLSASGRLFLAHCGLLCLRLPLMDHMQRCMQSSTRCAVDQLPYQHITNAQPFFE